MPALTLFCVHLRPLNKPTKTTDVKNDIRYAAFQLLERIEHGGYIDRLLDTFLKQEPSLPYRDKNLLTELVYGVVRLQGKLDFAIAHFSQRPLKKLEPKVLILLRLGAYQLVVLDRIPAHAAVNSTVSLVHKCGLSRAAGLVNGILRNLERHKIDLPWPQPDSGVNYLVNGCSLPEWIAKQLLQQFSKTQSFAFAEALSQPAPMTLRANTIKTTRKSFVAKLMDHGHTAAPCQYAPEGLILSQRGPEPIPGDREGWFQVQDEASILIAHLLEPKPGERILDACAAPGGKTLHMAALAENKADILAMDKHPGRIGLITSGAKRLGVVGINTKVWDLMDSPEFLPQNSFDKILVDAPCSGLGVIRRNPEIRWRRTPKEVVSMAQVQIRILESVAPLLRPGGQLVYSVCTFTEAETTDVVDTFLSTHPTWYLDNLNDFMPAGWKTLFDEKGRFRSFPQCHGRMDAFFAARLTKMN